MNELLTEERVLQLIHKIRNQKVMLDSKLAEMYGIPTKRLNEQVKQNLDRFPIDFILQLNQEKGENLKSQFSTASWVRTLKTEANPRID
ncbi:ORF6N domain-containing protein [Algoriphagus aquaeductus]|uniref:ORF6N domain-containing protein n=1 Tax=Algoriphagus aquaeductus TaxID=475299 RepID=A0A326RQB4_9BACT|nr:ORF6N domain-containing protein [Algoriphagus aquaeductus]PZV83479.1 ORF6N domain-containing protein [Algoriphagus aquaeductus]